MSFSYSVAIRTLGKAGEKYLQTLRSINSQTVPPKSICVYIPYGYDLPEYTIGIEKYIRCTKGMVAQRALSFSEINDEWILFLDDDIFLPSDYVEKAQKFILENNIDVLTASFYQEHQRLLTYKFKILFQCIFPFISNKWEYKINKAGRYVYNIAPKSFMKTQTGPGACVFCRKEVYISSRFYEEQWMDDLGYALGDDQLFHYKMYLRGAKEYIWNDSGALHLDAGNANRKFDRNAVRKSALALFLVWHRSVFKLKKNNILDKAVAIIAYACSVILKLLYSCVQVINGVPMAPISILQGVCEGIKYTKKNPYVSLPYFDEK